VASLVRTDDGGIEVVRTRADSAAQGRSLAARLRSEPDVLDAALDTRVTAQVVPADDPQQDRQWGLPAINAKRAWAEGDASGQVVAVIDSGVDGGHPDLAAALVPGHDYVRGDSDPDDESGHGTHVAGTVAAVAGNGVGVAGAALRAKVMPIKVLDAAGSGSSADVAAAIRLAVESGADVINLSLGGPTPSTLMSAAISDALAKGVPVVAAAGNQSSSTPNYPAAQPGVIAVGAVDRTLAHASFSNTGNHLAVVGPGVSIHGTTRRTDAAPSGYGAMSGTSMATPHVASVVALLRAAAPTADVSRLRDAVVDTAADLGATGHDATYGAGLVDAAAARARIVKVTPSPSPSPSPTQTQTPSPTPSPEPSQTPSPTPSPEPSPSRSRHRRRAPRPHRPRRRARRRRRSRSRSRRRRRRRPPSRPSRRPRRRRSSPHPPRPRLPRRRPSRPWSPCARRSPPPRPPSPSR
jgi:subtilisin family serine protease